MKKILYLISVLLLSILLISCGGSGSSSSDDGKISSKQKDYWNSDWYGMLFISEGKSDYVDIEGITDCFMTTEVNDEGKGKLIFWDEFESKDEPLAKIDIRIEEDDEYDLGILVSEKGAFYYDGEVKDGDWSIKPSYDGFDNLIYIDNIYQDPTEEGAGFRYEMLLRPWGLDWEEIEEEVPGAAPRMYYDWYLPAIDAGEDMPDSVEFEY